MSDNKNIKTSQVVTTHPSSLKHSNINSPQKMSLWSKLSNAWPVSIAIILSILWISSCFFIAKELNLNMENLSIIELSSVFSAAILPIIMLWLICLALLRINPLKESHHSLSKGLDQLLGPIDMAQKRVANIVETLQNEIKNIESAGDLATDRFKNLESNFQSEISALLSATIEADDKSTIIKNKLAGERDAIILLANDIDKHTTKINQQLKQYRIDATNINETAKKQSDNLNNEMSFQNKTLNSRTKEIETTLENMASHLSHITESMADQTNHSYINLSEIMDDFDERKAALNDFMTSMMGEVSDICEKLESQAVTLSDLTHKSSVDGEKITTNLHDQSSLLSLVAQKAVDDVNASGKVIEEQAKSMGQSIFEATENSKINIAQASDFFTEKANDLNRVSSGLENDIKQNFNQVEDLIADKAKAIGQNISLKFQTIEDDLDKSNVGINEMLVGNIERLKSLIDRNKHETKDYFNEVTASIENQSQTLEKSLNDMRINMIDKTTLMQDGQEELEKYTGNFYDKISKIEKNIHKQQKNMLAGIAIIEEGLEIAVNKINKNSVNLGSHGQKVIESIISQTTELTNQINEVQSRGKNSLRDIQNASREANDNILAGEKETSKIIDRWIKSANEVDKKYEKSMKQVERLVDKLTSMEDNGLNSLEEKEENIKRLSNQLLQSSDRIHLASNSAIEAVTETNHALDKNADKYQQMINAIQLSSQSLMLSGDAIENRLKNKNNELFSSLAKSIMEKLQSQSIDISKYLDDDLPQDLWDSYIGGDRNIFIRKIKKHIGKKTTYAIREQYKRQSEFRDHVDSFIDIFEELLDTFTHSTDDLYRETMLSSDLAKVYFALAEASGRLNHNG